MSPEAGTIEVDQVWKRFRADATMGAGAWLVDRLGRRRSAADRWRWALRDLSMRVDAGEAVGIVGVNGSGKSTLLKILTGTMDQTAGRVTVSGRVGALIELQAGLHPELTGRENVLAYSALMGLSRQRAAEVYSPVIELAGVGDAAHRQVKFYSTGMRLRLGFAIAAHLEAPILLVDEVLAVADAEFQRACLDRIGALHRDGTTVAVVSHDLGVIEATCDRVVWIDRGRLVDDGPVTATLDAYRTAQARPVPEPGTADEDVLLDDVVVQGPDGLVPRSGGPVSVAVHLRCPTAVTGVLRLGIGQAEAEPLLVVERREALPAGPTTALCRFDSLPLAGGSYRLWVGLEVEGGSGAAWRPRTGFDVHGLRAHPAGLPLAAATTWEVSSG
jgi:ABC-2 type transport system ATP-binding protein